MPWSNRLETSALPEELMDSYVTPETLELKTAQWLEKIGPFNQHKMEMNISSAALLVIDMQNFFLDPGSPTFTCGGLAILPNIKRLLKAFREASRPVIYTCHVHNADGSDAGIMKWWWEGMCVEGTPESLVHGAVAPCPREKIIYKHRYSAFYNTDLETVLRGLNIEDLVISGIMTNMCCESTARDAYYRDHRVFFLADATGSITEEMHLATLTNIAFGFAYVTTTDDIVRRLKGPSQELPEAADVIESSAS
jgi:ureidoacrylate peracid hydrolase